MSLQLRALNIYTGYISCGTLNKYTGITSRTSGLFLRKTVISSKAQVISFSAELNR